jgi:hypothetical protein
MDEPIPLRYQGAAATARFVDTCPTLALILEAHGVEVARCVLPEPSCGYGGHEIVVSPDGATVAVFVYSGQSDSWYELFALEPVLRHVGALPSVFGEGLAPTFSVDGRFLAFANVFDPYLGDHTPPAEVDWVELWVHALPDGPVERCLVRVALEAGAPGAEDGAYPAPPRFGPVGVILDCPWGLSVVIPLPLPATITVRGPSA